MDPRSFGPNDDPDASHVFLAPAKLNLFLHVVGRRDDGYHLIQSAMQLIDLCDRLRIEPSDDGRIERIGEVPGIPEADDLAMRAARLLQVEEHVARGARIAVEKRIPVGGGLGGGSSDAATVLLALNRLWRLDLPRERLMQLGLRLGADVPFFIAGEHAFVEGIGERVRPVPLPDARYALIHPGVTVPTAAIFGDPALTRNSEVLKISDFSDAAPALFRAASAAGRTGPARPLGNDLEPVASHRFPAVRAALAWLSSEWPGALGIARMSGSGACVFRPFDSDSSASACLATLPEGWRGWSVRSLERHPHRDRAH